MIAHMHRVLASIRCLTVVYFELTVPVSIVRLETTAAHRQRFAVTRPCNELFGSQDQTRQLQQLTGRNGAIVQMCDERQLVFVELLPNLGTGYAMPTHVRTL